METVVTFLVAIGLGAVGSVLKIGFGWLERVLADPVMRERINKGSDQFFAAEEPKWGELEIDGGERVDFRIPKSLARPTDRR